MNVSVKTSLVYQQIVSSLVYAIIVTMPLIFGAVHPIIKSVYIFAMLVGCGGWLLLNLESKSVGRPTFWCVVPVFLIIYLVFQSIPLPFDWVEILSPFRAERVRLVNELAGTNQQNISLSDSSMSGVYASSFLLGLILYYFTLKRLLMRDKNFLFTLCLCLIAVGTFEALYGIMQFIKPQLGILWLPLKARAAHGTIIYKNQYASLLNMIWPLAVVAGALYFKKKSKIGPHIRGESQFKEAAATFSTVKIQGPLLIFAAGLMVLAVLFSLSRGGILAMILTALFLIVLLPFSRAGKIQFLLVYFGLIFGYGALLGLDTLLARFGSLDTSGAHRIDIYLASLPLLIDHWQTGIGIGSYTYLSPVYLKGFPANIHYDQAHNEYLELIIELGIPFATLLFGWILFGMVKLLGNLLKAIKNAQFDVKRLAMGIASFCGLLGFLVHGAADFGWRLPVNLVFSVTLLAVCVSSIWNPIETDDHKVQVFSDPESIKEE